MLPQLSRALPGHASVSELRYTHRLAASDGDKAQPIKASARGHFWLHYSPSSPKANSGVLQNHRLGSLNPTMQRNNFLLARLVFCSQRGDEFDVGHGVKKAFRKQDRAPFNRAKLLILLKP